MVTITIDGKTFSVCENSTVLEAARQNGIHIPTLCYYKDLHEIGGCRLCLVEVEGEDKLVAACNRQVKDGMVVFTDTPRVISARKTNLQLILSDHDLDCESCIKDGSCTLQKLKKEFGIDDVVYPQKVAKTDLLTDFPLIKDNSKCVKCFRCVEVCETIQHQAVWQVSGGGKRTGVKTKLGLSLDNADCTLCGQCVTHCPTAALTARDDTQKFIDAVRSGKTVAVQVAPAVRTAFAEGLGLKDPAVGIMVAAIKKMGATYVFDTQFAADLTIMEEGAELISRIERGENMPMFTSCCPGWVRFLKAEHPDLLANLSTAKSPQQMFGATLKTYFAKKAGLSPKDIFSVSIMPCVAKKEEANLPQMDSSGERDVDLVLTTREFIRLVKKLGVDLASLKEEAFDAPLGLSTGAGAIFGTTGGVMEAALRSAHYLLNGKNPPIGRFTAIRRQDQYGLREGEFALTDSIKLKVAVVSGLSNTQRLIMDLKAKKCHYDFIEVMACPGGCVGGGGQPTCDGEELSLDRGKKLYLIDGEMPLRFSHENPSVIKAYEELFKKPLSHTAHSLLHVDHSK